jgi:mono/diheme cytochrome c family protein
MKILASNSILFTLAVMLGLSFAAQAQSGAEATYKAKCAMCHGAEGKGDSPMGKKLNIRDLGSPEVQKQTDAELTTIVTKGKGKMMPFEGKLTADQIGQLVAYIRELGKKK